MKPSLSCPQTFSALAGILLAGLLMSCNGSSSSASQPPATPPPTGSVDVTTFQYNNGRTGANLSETILTPSNVNSAKFGKVGLFSVDGKVDAQPLYLSQLSIAGVTHNVLFVATEHDTVYAFDADSGTALWQKSMLGSGEATSEAVNGCSQVTPEIGVTSTPVIDRSRGVIYLISMSKSGSTYFQRVHALNLTTGSDMFGGPVAVQAHFPGTGDGTSGGNVVFDPHQYEERAALLLANGTVYTTWTSHCDIRPYTGWVIAYDASTLTQTQVLNLTPNGSEGAVWMAGDGPAADSGNNLYFLTGNGSFDTALDGNGFPGRGDYGNSFMKLSNSGTLAVADYFTMSNTVAESNADTDLGSGGAIVLPDITDNGGQAHQLAVGAGKDSIIYVVDRTNLGKFHGTDTIYQEVHGGLAGSVFSTPAYFNQAVYYGSVGDAVKAFTFSNAKLGGTPSSKTNVTFPYPGATPGISANGTSNGIVWTVANSNPAVLHAYDATNLATELYNSNQASGARDQFGDGNKFIVPLIVNGKVYVGTPNGVAVFGLLP